MWYNRTNFLFGHMGKRTVEYPPDQFQLPFMATEHPLVSRGLDSAIITDLQQNPHWNSIVGHHAAIVDMDHVNGAIVDPRTIALERLVYDLDLSHEHRLGGVAIVSPRLNNEEADTKFFAQYVHPLSPGGVLLVYEPYEKILPPKNARKQVLHDAGYKHIGFSHSDKYLIWHAQKQKEAHRNPVNIWESERAGQKAQQYLSFMRKAYATSGFVLLSDTAIIERLSASTFVPQDLLFLLEGRGVTLLSPCGCEIEKTYNDIEPWVIVNEVPECGHVGMQESIELFDHIIALRMPYQEPSHAEIVPVVTTAPPSEILLTVSKDEHPCGEIQYVSRAQNLIHRNGHQYMRYKIDKFCPHCGDIFRDKTRFVDVLRS